MLLSSGLLAWTWNLAFCPLTLEKGRLLKWAMELGGEREEGNGSGEAAFVVARWTVPPSQAAPRGQ